MITRLDHLMLVVADVDAAMATFRDTLGMTAVYGGRHPRGTHNALVHFPGTLCYLELFGPYDREQIRREGNPATLDWIEQGGGVWRFAVGTDDLAGVHARLASLNVPINPIGNWNRKRDDGSVVYWQMFGLAIPEPPRLYPFFIQWAPDAERSADLQQAGFFPPHRLPVTAVERVTCAVTNGDAAVADFERIYGKPFDPAVPDPALGGTSRLMRTAEGAIALVEPSGPGLAQAGLDRGGPGAFLVSLASADVAAARAFLAGNGVRVTEIAPRGDGRPAFLIDPADAHGIAFEVVEG